MDQERCRKKHGPGSTEYKSWTDSDKGQSSDPNQPRSSKKCGSGSTAMEQKIQIRVNGDGKCVPDLTEATTKDLKLRYTILNLTFLCLGNPSSYTYILRRCRSKNDYSTTLGFMP
jgi:hypothetical protein